MNKILLFLALALPCCLMAQVKPGKFEIRTGLIENKYTVDNQMMTRKATMAHLEAHDMNAARYFQRAKYNDNSFYFFAAMSLVGSIVGLNSDNRDVRMAGNRVAIGAGATSIVCVLLANRHEKKASKQYNLKFGYQ